MTWLDEILKRFGVLAKYSEDDRINASTEEAARVHGSAVTALHEATEKRRRGNEALRQSIETAKQRTNSLAEFERHIQRENRRNVRRTD